MRGITAGGLAVSAVLHLRLAHDYPAGSPISQGAAFRVQAVLALLAAAAVLAAPAGRRLVWALAGLLAGGSLAALLLARYWAGTRHLPVLQYEPAWYRDKDWTAVAEALATAGALIGASLPGGADSPRPAGAGRGPTGGSLSASR